MKLTLFGDSTIARATPPDGEMFVSILGDTRIDLTRVRLPQLLRLRAIVLVGDVTLTVPPGTAVEFAGVSIIGDRSFRPRPTAGTTAERSGQQTVLRVTTFTLVGEVKVIEAER